MGRQRAAGWPRKLREGLKPEPGLPARCGGLAPQGHHWHQLSTVGPNSSMNRSLTPPPLIGRVSAKTLLKATFFFTFRSPRVSLFCEVVGPCRKHSFRVASNQAWPVRWVAKVLGPLGAPTLDQFNLLALPPPCLLLHVPPFHASAVCKGVQDACGGFLSSSAFLYSFSSSAMESTDLILRTIPDPPFEPSLCFL